MMIYIHRARKLNGNESHNSLSRLLGKSKFKLAYLKKIQPGAHVEDVTRLCQILVEYHPFLQFGCPKTRMTLHFAHTPSAKSSSSVIDNQESQQKNCFISSQQHATCHHFKVGP